MRRADRGLSVAGPRSSSRPTAQNPSLPINSYMSAARWRAGIARRYDTKGTPTDINTHTRATVRTSHRRPGRTTARACVRRRPPVRPSVRPPARPPARPSARVWEVRQVPDLAGFVATIIVVVPVVVVTHIVAVIGSGGSMMECRASVCRVVAWCGAWNERWCHETPITSPHAPV